MTRHDLPARTLAICLAALAGYVDALGFLQLGGYFVSFMSGNSTRLAVGLANGSSAAIIAAFLIGSFVTGVIASSICGRFARRRAPAILTLVAVLLALAAVFAAVGWTVGAVSVMAMAMGAENGVFEREGEVSIGVTYMTGTLVKLGQGLAAALLGGDRLAWMPYLLLWLGLVGGAACGARLYFYVGLQGLWFAVLAAAVLALVATRLPHPIAGR